MPQSPIFQIQDLLEVLDSSAKSKASTPPEANMLRSIVTYMRRTTPLSTAQKSALDRAQHEIIQKPIGDPRSIFSSPDQPLTVEIGFGMGTTLAQMAADEPSRNFLGIEVHVPGIAQLLHEKHQRHLNNLHVMQGDAITFFDAMEDACIDTVQLFFPDPWQKRKHYKRRFVLPERMQLMAQKLKTGGLFHAATDWEHYAHWMLAVLERMPQWHNPHSGFAPRPSFRPYTKFEQRGIHSGHGVWDIMVYKQSNP